ncbi:MAG: glycosyltransferase, partial [Synechococcaceae bacterium WB9_4xB_025]|nr:glycosyltransferase [Synechococcaceae bacterium WB9_4xB_025]
FEVIHEGVDLQTLAPNPKRHVQLSDHLILRYGDPVITYVSRSLEPLRGFRTLMRALPALQKAHTAAQVLIVGDHARSSYSPACRHPQGYRGEMLALLGNRIDHERLHFLGRVPYEQLIAILQISAAHVYFTVPYALSWSVLEAMACGAAVVGSANPPVTELIHEGKTGRLVPFHDHEQLSTVLLDLLGDAQARTQLGQAGRRSVAQRYNLTDSVTAYEQLIHSLRLVRPATHG